MSQWPRSFVVRFAINANIVKVEKDDYLCRAGEEAEAFYLVISGELSETQPITLRRVGEGGKILPVSAFPGQTSVQW